MRLDIDRQRATVTLSRRNLLALLTKLDMPESARTIWSTHAPDEWILVVKAEEGEEHYAERGFGPGPMHPETEAAIVAVGG